MNSNCIPRCRPIRWPADSLERKRVCRTFSDCTTAPRAGSGCFPLDPFYKALPEAEQVKAVSRAARLRH